MSIGSDSTTWANASLGGWAARSRCAAAPSAAAEQRSSTVCGRRVVGRRAASVRVSTPSDLQARGGRRCGGRRGPVAGARRRPGSARPRCPRRRARRSGRGARPSRRRGRSHRPHTSSGSGQGRGRGRARRPRARAAQLATVNLARSGHSSLSSTTWSAAPGGRVHHDRREQVRGRRVAVVAGVHHHEQGRRGVAEPERRDRVRGHLRRVVREVRLGRDDEQAHPVVVDAAHREQEAEVVQRLQPEPAQAHEPERRLDEVDLRRVLAGPRGGHPDPPVRGLGTHRRKSIRVGWSTRAVAPSAPWYATSCIWSSTTVCARSMSSIPESREVRSWSVTAVSF